MHTGQGQLGPRPQPCPVFLPSLVRFQEEGQAGPGLAPAHKHGDLPQSTVARAPDGLAGRACWGGKEPQEAGGLPAALRASPPDSKVFRGNRKQMKPRSQPPVCECLLLLLRPRPWRRGAQLPTLPSPSSEPLTLWASESGAGGCRQLSTAGEPPSPHNSASPSAGWGPRTPHHVHRRDGSLRPDLSMTPT